MNQPMKCYPHKTILNWSVILTFLYTSEMIAKYIFAPIDLQQDYQGIMLVGHEGYRYVLLNLIDTLVGLTLLFLFYQQAKLNMQKNNEKTTLILQIKMTTKLRVKRISSSL